MSEPLGRIVGALSPHADVAAMTQVLQETLRALLPAHLVRVERRRSLADRIAGRPGEPVELGVRCGDRELVLRRAGATSTAAPEALVVHTVHDVVLSRRAVPITEWIETLAIELQRMAAEDDAARQALDRLLFG